MPIEIGADHYQALIESLPLVTYIERVGTPSRTVFISPQIEDLLGHPAQRWVDDPELFPSSLHPEDRRRVLAEIERTRADGSDFCSEYRLVGMSGEVVWVLDEARTVRGDDGRPLYLHGFVLEVTERKQLEEQLRHIQKLDAVGRLASTVAHDFNNLLTAIHGYADLVFDALPVGSELLPQVNEIRKASIRAAALTRQLLVFSRKQVLNPTELSVNEIVVELEPMLGRLLGERVRLETSLAPSPVRVLADRDQLGQVVLNLAVNARDAMPDGGVVQISTASVDVGADGRPGEPEPGAYVRLAVSDDGIGIAPDVRSRMFEPFFSTKEPGKGTGLGLSSVYGIVRQSRGSIRVESEPGEGATFAVYLPRI
ncbi:MAG: two-component system sensor histidine kinase NtrB [Gaiellaceae bacterium]